MGIELECVAIEKGDNTSVILGHAGFIKTVEDLYEAYMSAGTVKPDFSALLHFHLFFCST